MPYSPGVTIDRAESGVDERDRAALVRLAASSARRQVKLFADFGRDWPLWEDDLAHDEVNICSSPADYGLSEILTSEMRSWFDFWKAHYDANTLWDTSANHAEWWSRGRVIAAALREELRDIADVEFVR